MKKYFWFIFLSLLLSCKKDDSVLKYNQTTNSIELTDKDYVILAFDVLNTSKKEIEKKEVSIEFRNESKVNLNLDSIFIQNPNFNFKNSAYEMRVLLQKVNFKDSLVSDTEKYKIMTLSSTELNSGQTSFKELLK
ncbi:hypothetical protein MG290_12680 [Flavobacterium sp. CBA20B-1]|uniref:hypothetical protein n=1 Tax=unclassified Flavobacterium TaxID=196869 RepID=UPI002224C230|nr:MULTISPECIES: hypothetical protein [unclassified Flavobacterium]WCM41785.1 hypothetical protein MG290_12680 [Flavobacterium sp. CBA20B-1]